MNGLLRTEVSVPSSRSGVVPAVFILTGEACDAGHGRLQVRGAATVAPDGVSVPLLVFVARCFPPGI